jgi:hypothetical protein
MMREAPLSCGASHLLTSPACFELSRVIENATCSCCSVRKASWIGHRRCIHERPVTTGESRRFAQIGRRSGRNPRSQGFDPRGNGYNGLLGMSLHFPRLRRFSERRAGREVHEATHQQTRFHVRSRGSASRTRWFRHRWRGGGGGEEPLKCNSGRGNGSEGNASQLLVPGTDTGPGVFPTVDCDPGNSGAVNRAATSLRRRGAACAEEAWAAPN